LETHVYEGTFSMMKQVKSKNRKLLADKRLGRQPPSCTTNTGIEEGTIVSEKPQPHVSH